jgi:hypothetical protein
MNADEKDPTEPSFDGRMVLARAAVSGEIGCFLDLSFWIFRKLVAARPEYVTM